MVSEPGLFPTLYLTLVASLRAAAPGACLSLRVDGIDSQTLTRDRLILLEEQTREGWIISAHFSEWSRWRPRFERTPPISRTVGASH